MTHDAHLRPPPAGHAPGAWASRSKAPPATFNAITDVPGVEVGYATLISGDGPLVVGSGPVRTGVTAIHPRGRADPGTACAAGFSSLNGNGEMTGTVWIEEAGALCLPVTITNTHAVGIAQEATIAWTTERHPQLTGVWALPVAAETWDGYLNDINGRHVTSDVVMSALDGARGGADRGGLGRRRHGHELLRLQGRIGQRLAHRRARQRQLRRRRLRAGQLRLAQASCRSPACRSVASSQTTIRWPTPRWIAPPGAGSVIVIVATDAPLLPGQCKALARRVPLGLARTGTTGSHFSGDIFLAFSTANHGALHARAGRRRAGGRLRVAAFRALGRASIRSSTPSCRPPRRPC